MFGNKYGDGEFYAIERLQIRFASGSIDVFGAVLDLDGAPLWRRFKSTSMEAEFLEASKEHMHNPWTEYNVSFFSECIMAGTLRECYQLWYKDALATLDKLSSFNPSNFDSLRERLEHSEFVENNPQIFI